MKHNKLEIIEVAQSLSGMSDADYISKLENCLNEDASISISENSNNYVITGIDFEKLKDYSDADLEIINSVYQFILKEDGYLDFKNFDIKSLMNYEHEDALINQDEAREDLLNQDAFNLEEISKNSKSASDELKNKELDENSYQAENQKNDQQNPSSIQDLIAGTISFAGSGLGKVLRSPFDIGQKFIGTPKALTDWRSSRINAAFENMSSKADEYISEIEKFRNIPGMEDILTKVKGSGAYTEEITSDLIDLLSADGNASQFAILKGRHNELVEVSSKFFDLSSKSSEPDVLEKMNLVSKKFEEVSKNAAHIPVDIVNGEVKKVSQDDIDGIREKIKKIIKSLVDRLFGKKAVNAASPIPM